MEQTEKRGLLSFEGISKSFGGVQALRDVSFSIDAGEIHGLVGENGAGKSTLIKVCGGVYRPDHGKIIMDSDPVHFRSPRDAEDAGIRSVHQEVPICLSLTVAENIFLDPNPPRRGVFLARREMNRRSEETLARLGVVLDPERPAGLCSPAERQLVMIARSLAQRARLIVLDEATSSLADAEVGMLFQVLDNLRDEGTTFLFVSHRLREVIEISDRVTVLRNGRHIQTSENRPKKLTLDHLAEMIVGRQVEGVSRDRDTKPPSDGSAAMEVRGLNQKAVGLEDITFTLARGEILGLAGLRGAGRTELLQCLFGRKRADSGKITIGSRTAIPRSPADGIRLSIGFLSESRGDAVFYRRTVRANIVSAIVDRLRRFLLLDRSEYNRVATDIVRDLRIDTPSIHTDMQNLSGGNQQKVLLGRWLAARPSILLLDEPTRGVDVGAKAEIRRRILELARNGMAILYVAQDFEELEAIADRVLIISDGRVVDELKGEELTVTNMVKQVNAYARSVEHERRV